MYVTHVKMLCLKYNSNIYIAIIFIKEFNSIVVYTLIYIQLKGVLNYCGC